MEAAKVLLERGADPNQANEKGWTPLHHIIMASPDSFELFKLVVAKGGRLDVITKDGRSMITFCRNRRADYEDPDYSGAPGLREKLVGYYSELEKYIQSETE